MADTPSFLRKEATKKKGPHGAQNKTAITMMVDAMKQVALVLANAFRPEAPAQRKSASPLGRGPLGDVKRGPAPPPGAIRHEHDEDDNGDEGRGQ